MKTTFNKLALAIGATAAVAASMNAQAIITSIPGEANLVPVFYYATASDAFGAGLKNTVVKLTTPRSVGGDTVISFFTPNLTPATVESASNPVLSSTISAYGGGVVANVLASSQVHWFFLDEQSNHVVNGTIPVSADDVTIIDAFGLLADHNPADIFYNGKVGYLVLTTQTASNGTAKADFAFAADAYISVNSLTTPGAPFFTAPTSVPAAITIPTLPMSDGVDTTTYPTTTNNVIEKLTTSSSTLFPIASPLYSGTRTGVVGGQPIRVLDIPLSERGDNDNVIVFWNDRNGLTTQALAFDNIEQNCSTNLTLPQQLNIFRSGTNVAGGIALVDNYVKSGAKTASPAFSPVLPLCSAGLDTSDGELTEGFVKLFITAPTAPTGATGAYASAVAFTIPVVPVVQDDQDDAPQATLNAIDVGTFASR